MPFATIVKAPPRDGPQAPNLLDYEPALSHEHDWNPYPEFDSSNEMPANLFVPENTLMDTAEWFLTDEPFKTFNTE